MLDYLGRVGASVASWIMYLVGEGCWWGYQKAMVASAKIDEAYDLEFLWKKVE